MSRLKFPDKHYRFPSEIIEYTIRLFYHSKFSYIKIEELLAEKGILVSYETIRRWCKKFGPQDIRRMDQTTKDNKKIPSIDCVHVNIHGQPCCLWRSFDENDNVEDIYIQSHQNNITAERFLNPTVTKYL